LIPDQLEGTQFIKLAREGKEPIHEDGSKGTKYHQRDDELLEWLDDGGNAGRVFNDSLIAFDVDTEEFLSILEEELPETFTVTTGSGGKHLYFRCPTWEQKKQFSKDGKDLGSIRTGNWYTVVPPSVHPNGSFYVVENPVEVAEISEAEVRSVVEETTEGSTSNTRRRAPRCVGSIPNIYPEREVSWKTMRRWLSANSLLSLFNKKHLDDRSGRDFVIAKCLAEGGFSEESIREAMNRLPHNAKWKKRDESYRKRTVRNAIQEAVEDDYVSFEDTTDDASFKEGEDAEGNHPSGGKSMSFEYDQIKSFHVYDGDGQEDVEDGDRVVKVELTSMEGVGDDGEQVDTEFVSISKGKFQDDGEFGVSPNYPGDSKSIGNANPEDLRLIAEGLEELAEELE
jgi:hypothetical protein